MVEWIEKLGEKLKAVREVISVKEGIAKETRRSVQHWTRALMAVG